MDTKKLLGVLLVGVGICITLSQIPFKKKEHFTQGYDYKVDGCIKQCELDLLRRNPYFTQLQQGGYMTQNYCRLICASQYNQQRNDDFSKKYPNKYLLNKYSRRRNPCDLSTCPKQRCPYIRYPIPDALKVPGSAPQCCV